MFSRSWSRAPTGLLAVSFAAMSLAGPASAQEMVHRFISPGFGGNPFNTDYLLGTANIHRPAQPEEEGEGTPSEQELIARQIQARFLSNLSSEIVDAINAAQPGDTGDFELGDQRISFVRTETETRITFFNGRTGETSVVVVPDRTATASALGTLGAGTLLGTGGAGALGLGTVGAPLPGGSAEQALGARGANPGALTGRPGGSNPALELPPLPGL